MAANPAPTQAFDGNWEEMPGFQRFRTYQISDQMKQDIHISFNDNPRESLDFGNVQDELTSSEPFFLFPRKS
ncbi:MAG TPA: hypothetical protein VIL86_08930 [Tepidisphaeraceae bacterium]|jgi:hypothetical protein